jgi:hypothetical protein
MVRLHRIRSLNLSTLYPGDAPLNHLEPSASCPRRALRSRRRQAGGHLTVYVALALLSIAGDPQPHGTQTVPTLLQPDRERPPTCVKATPTSEVLRDLPAPTGVYCQVTLTT